MGANGREKNRRVRYSCRVVQRGKKLNRREKREWTKEKREIDETRILRVKGSTNRFLKSKLPCKTPDKTRENRVKYKRLNIQRLGSIFQINILKIVEKQMKETFKYC